MDALPGLLPPAPAPGVSLPLAALRPRLATLAARGVYLGTSSWRYPGWLGVLYDPARYEFRGRHSETRFHDHSLAEYAATFPTVGVDATYYAYPTEKFMAELRGAVPPAFRFVLKVTDELTVKRFPALPRFAGRAGQPNPFFLDAPRFARRFLAPLAGVREQVGLIVFEFSRFGPADFARGREFMAALDAFLALLPAGWPYGVELRNAGFLHPELFARLRARGVAYVFNQWSGGTALDRQLDLADAWPVSFAGARLLTRPGTNYEQRDRELAPFNRLQEPFPEARAAIQRLVRDAAARSVRPLYLVVGNKLEGCAPWTIAELAEQLLEQDQPRRDTKGHE
jgi:uncharacterized protein YecE (DUF72 family)